MNVTDQAALAFFKAFAQLESELKQHARFLIDARGRHSPAFIDWESVRQAADLLSDPPLRERLSEETQLRMLGDPARNRPRRQEIIGTNTAKRAIFQYRLLPPTDAAALVEAAYRVRNNLFHGGKEQVWNDNTDDDEPFVIAALEITQLLIKLMQSHELPLAALP